jgi:hypothetical protein
MSDMSSYVDTELIECSRRSSVESLAGNNDNNAIFTNKLGNGVKLNVGDQISIHSAIINERGAGSETIELKGNIIGKTSKYVTKVTPFSVKDNYLDSGYIDVLNRVDAVNIEEELIEKDLKDNQVHMTIEYYKATNGENCFSLPRRFVPVTQNECWRVEDGFQTGAPFRPQRNGTIVEVDYSRDRNASSPWTSSWISNQELLKIRQDGTKFLICVRQGGTFYNVNSSITVDEPVLGPTEIGANVDSFKNGNGSIDPACAVYESYKELKTIEIPKGRRSADFIAETFTNSLQNASSLEGYDSWYNQNNPSTSNVWNNQGVLAGVYKTSTFKPFNCATGDKFQEYAMIDSVIDWDYNASTLTQDILDWVNNFQYVAFKRPDFVLAGHNNIGRSYIFPGPLHQINHVNNDSSVGRTKMKISINASYNASNCENFSKWFKTQKLYPEFWDFRNSAGKYYNNSVKLTSNNSRFLHIDMVQAYDNASKTLAVERHELGSDCYYGDSDTDLTTDKSNIIKYNTPSEPLFITFIPEDEDTFYTNPIYEGENKKLSFGCMAKGPQDSIQFITEGVGGVPESYYNASGYFIGGWEAVGNASYNASKYKRSIGYDPHFTAYGNAAIGLWTNSFAPDFAENTFVGYTALNTTGSQYLAGSSGDKGGVINQVYIGSSNPKLTYDPTKDRFGFTDFYTPEYLGNKGGAGDNGALNPVKDGSAIVYKINKRLRKQAYAPGMGPYSDQQQIRIKQTYANASGHKLPEVDVDFDLPNKNIYPFSIMDCHSGICISDFGIDSKTWDNSLMGILGFSYNQLQSPVSENNTIQNRVNTFNQNNLNKVTTQALIKAEDTLIMNQNIFGGIMYHPEILSAVYIADAQHPTTVYQWSPPLNIESPSLTLTAEGVPKSMLNPFFSIRSNIIDDTSAYLGSVDSGQNLPTMGTILKNYNSGDYFYGEESSITFTVTKPKTITSITTSINDPDGTFCRVDDSSAVIYKIQRNKQYPVNLFEEFMTKK